jgi:hypothetical protein
VPGRDVGAVPGGDVEESADLVGFPRLELVLLDGREVEVGGREVL